MDTVKVIECPRDAWQGLTKIIPTEAKVAYLRKLLELGFRHLDAVSFVAPKYVPQMADSEAVIKALAAEAGTDRGPATAALKGGSASASPQAGISGPEIIGIIVNEQGLERALATPGLTTLGYPYSVSANFRRQNANMSLLESRALVEKLQRAVGGRGGNGSGDNLKLVVYISMAFGNPYGEPWSPEIVEDALIWLRDIGVKTVSLADTVGTAKPEEVRDLFQAVIGSATGMELGIHLHSHPGGAAEKVMAAYEAGCRRFDSALTGLGGCPFAGDELVGNIPTEIVTGTLAARGVSTELEPWAMLAAVEATKELRQQYAP